MLHTTVKNNKLSKAETARREKESAFANNYIDAESLCECCNNKIAEMQDNDHVMVCNHCY